MGSSTKTPPPFREDMRLETTINKLKPENLKRVLQDLRNEDLWYTADPADIHTEKIGTNTYKQVDKSKGVPMATFADVEVQELSGGKIDVVLHGRHVISGKVFGYEFHYQLEASPDNNGTLVVGLVELKGLAGLKPFRKTVIAAYKNILLEAFERLKLMAEAGVFDKIIFAPET